MKKIILLALSLLLPALAFAGPYDHQETNVFPSNTSFSAGDLPFTNALAQIRRLPIGTSGQVLTVSSALLPAWASTFTLGNNLALKAIGSDGITPINLLTLNNGDEVHLLAGVANTILFDVTGKVSLGYDGSELYPGTNGGADVGFSTLKFNKGYINTIRQSAATSLTAAGTNQATCLALTSTFNNVTTAGAGTAVCLFDGTLGQNEIVRNGGANALKVCPATGSGTINGGSGGACVTLSNTNAHMANCVAVGTDTWACSDSASAA